MALLIGVFLEIWRCFVQKVVFKGLLYSHFNQQEIVLTDQDPKGQCTYKDFLKIVSSLSLY